MNGTQRYSRPAIWLHWIVAALMLVNVGLGFYGQFAPDDWARPVIDAHKSVGITVLGLAVLRLSWRISHPPPPLPRRYRPWERFAAHAVHGALYALIFALPLTGWAHDSAWKGLPEHPMRWFGLIPVPPIGAIANLPPDDKERWHDHPVHRAPERRLHPLCPRRAACRRSAETPVRRQGTGNAAHGRALTERPLRREPGEQQQPGVAVGAEQPQRRRRPRGVDAKDLPGEMGDEGEPADLGEDAAAGADDRRQTSAPPSPRRTRATAARACAPNSRAVERMPTMASSRASCCA